MNNYAINLNIYATLFAYTKRLAPCHREPARGCGECGKGRYARHMVVSMARTIARVAALSSPSYGMLSYGSCFARATFTFRVNARVNVRSWVPAPDARARMGKVCRAIKKRPLKTQGSQSIVYHSSNCAISFACCSSITSAQSCSRQLSVSCNSSIASRWSLITLGTRRFVQMHTVVIGWL